ncbi:MAG: hypothetical protein ABFR47_03840 [Verrucomicrobiota bacterium]
MKRIVSIAAIALLVAGSSVFACDTCAPCKAKKADKKPACCGKKDESCSKKAKKCEEKCKKECTAKKSAKKCAEDCKKKCCAPKAEDKK